MLEINLSYLIIIIDYEPSANTVHPPPRKTAEGGFIYFHRCQVFPKGSVLKGKPVLFGVIQVKRLKNVVSQHIHSNQILINLTLFDDLE